MYVRTTDGLGQNQWLAEAIASINRQTPTSLDTACMGLLRHESRDLCRYRFGVASGSGRGCWRLVRPR
jgi:hypothetical protein